MTAPITQWFPPKDWTPGETLLESDFDEQFSSNLLFLKTPTQDRISAGTTTNTTSASFVDISGVTITMTTNAYKCNVIFGCTIGLSVAATVVMTLLIDGTSVGDASWGLQTITRGAASNDAIGFTFPTDVLSAASHTFKMQWKTSAGTLTLQPGWWFYVEER